MAIRITHVRLSSGGNAHEHITHVQWIAESDGKSYQAETDYVVNLIDKEGVEAYVLSDNKKASVGVVKPDGRKPYLRTHADGYWNDNLLSLPRF